MKKRRYGEFNGKRALAEQPLPDDLLSRLTASVSYGGNPEHKKNPGDYGLTPPATARAGKTLCDGVGIFKRKEALDLLKNGISRGLISKVIVDGWPKNIWSVTEDGRPLEAQLENSATGAYHGYPMPEVDPFAVKVLQCWRQV